MPPAKTIPYQLIWEELSDLSKFASNLSREEKDARLETFMQTHSRYFSVGFRVGGIPEIELGGNMLNFFARQCHYDKETVQQRFKEVFEEFIRRRYGNT